MTKLMDVCELIVDCPHTTAPDEGVGYPLIRTPNIGKGRLILENVHRVCKEVYDARNARAIPQVDDIILAREAPAGNVALIQKGQEVCLGQRTVLIRADKGKVNPAYLTYYLLAPKQQHDLKSSANGATVGHINMSRIRGLKIDLPALNIQDKIAGILSAYDNLIDNYRRQIKLLEEAAQRLYKEWFVDLRFPGYEHTKIVDGVPEGWNMGRLKDIGEFRRGKTITSKHVVKGKIPVVAGGLEPACYHNKFNTESPVITVSGSGANAGFTRLYNEKVWASDCSFLDASKCDSLYFVYSFLKSSKAAIDNLQKGAAQPHVYAKDLNGLAVLIPPNNILAEYSMIVQLYFDKIKTCQQIIANVQEARDRLLPKLMSGEIKV